MQSKPEVTALEAQEWDAVIVGTGIGGATLGYALARAGNRVLFCDQGAYPGVPAPRLAGRFAETFYSGNETEEEVRREILSRAGRYSRPLMDRSSGKAQPFVPFIGAGAGGSSALYGMAMERLLPEDFRPAVNYREFEHSLPERWPVSYEEMTPWYDAAELLYRVRNTPCRPSSAQWDSAPPLSEANQAVWTHLTSKGLSPYRLPMACEFVPDCQGCQGHLCDRDCKNDSLRACLRPALEDFGARFLPHCEALRLEADRGGVNALICDWNGTSITLRAKHFIVAAGALRTPTLLLNSVSDQWPNGLANHSGLVGRHLMRHCIDLYAIRVGGGALGNNLKELAFNDLYNSGGVKLGSVQSFGAMPPPEVIVAEFEQTIHNSYGQLAARVFRLLRPVILRGIAYLFADRLILATIMEDLPRYENRVEACDERGNPSIMYRLHQRDRERANVFRQKMRKILKPYRYILLKQAEDNQRIAHVCGTCRFGDDEKTSVLNQYNRAHGLDNLYVVDSSCFPSSGGTNPSLTIAANALRVADHILQNELHDK